MLRIKQIGTICFAISLLISAPLFATDISSSASTADCKHTPLQVYSGTSNLEAGWEPNTIALHWYNGDTELTVPSASQSCVYDETLTPPTTIPTKTGYTFKGWRVRPPQCSLSGLNRTINSNLYGYTRLNGNAGSNEVTYGLTPGSGEWAVEYSYGTIFGMAKCSAKSGDNNNFTWNNESSNWAATKTELDSESGIKKYCWCKAVKYIPSGGNLCYVDSSLWIYYTLYSYNGGSTCLNNCAYNCIDIYYNANFRRAMFVGP